LTLLKKAKRLSLVEVNGEVLAVDGDSSCVHGVIVLFVWSFVKKF
jgi:hypothetical protein